jgi:hypothetical protein
MTRKFRRRKKTPSATRTSPPNGRLFQFWARCEPPIAIRMTGQRRSTWRISTSPKLSSV